MALSENGSLLQAGRAYADAEGVEDVLVPLTDPELYWALVNEAFMQLPVAVRDQTVAVVDVTTAARSHGFAGTARDLNRVLIAGAPDAEMDLPDNATMILSAAGGSIPERYCLIHGPSIRFAAVVVEGERGDTVDTSGYWTTYSRCVDAMIAGYPLSLENGRNTSIDLQERAALRLMQTMRRHFRAGRRQGAAPHDDLEAVLNVLQAISAPGSIHDVLYTFVEQIADTIDVDRCSVVRIKNNAEHGVVLASHEDERLQNREIELAKYPEIRRALKTGETVVVNDVRLSDVMRPVCDAMTKAGFVSVLVAPVILFDNNMGSLLLRVARRHDGFLDRDVNFCEIVAESASNALERAHLIESIQGANERLERLAITDGLTGLYNFRFFRDRLEKEYSRSDRYGNPLSCILIDIDDFKRVNDTYGHLQGDEILRDIADLAVRSNRQSDVVARYGGEELVALLPQTGMTGAMRQAERLRSEIESHKFDGLPKGERITVSIGVAEFSKEHMKSCEDLVRAADEGLYAAKQRGKNQVVALQKEKVSQ